MDALAPSIRLDSFRRHSFVERATPAGRIELPLLATTVSYTSGCSHDHHNSTKFVAAKTSRHGKRGNSKHAYASRNLDWYWCHVLLCYVNGLRAASDYA
jgi:hypothetical protein